MNHTNKYFSTGSMQTKLHAFFICASVLVHMKDMTFGQHYTAGNWWGDNTQRCASFMRLFV